MSSTYIFKILFCNVKLINVTSLDPNSDDEQLEKSCKQLDVVAQKFQVVENYLEVS
jgi:hypothetical protein